MWEVRTALSTSDDQWAILSLPSTPGDSYIRHRCPPPPPPLISLIAKDTQFYYDHHVYDCYLRNLPPQGLDRLWQPRSQRDG